MAWPWPLLNPGNIVSLYLTLQDSVILSANCQSMLLFETKHEIGWKAYPATQLFACKNTELKIVLQTELDTRQSAVSTHVRATQTLTATRSISVQTIPSCRSKGQSTQLSSFIFCYRSKADGPDNFTEIILPWNFAFSSVLLQTKPNQSNPTDRKYRTVLHMVASFIPN